MRSQLLMLGFVLFESCLWSIGLADDPPPTDSSANSRIGRSRGELELVKKQREAAIKALREAFDADRSLDVRIRLKQAAKMTSELAAKAERASATQLAASGIDPSSRKPLFPRTSHAAKLIAHRPWIRDFWGEGIVDHQLEGNHNYRLGAATTEFRWPTEKEHVKLRSLLRDRDPEIQAMAIEALATLHEPSDVHAIAEFLDQSTPVVPILKLELSCPLDVEQLAYEPDDPLLVGPQWEKATLGDYAKRALQLMTGVDLTAESFAPWVARHHADRDSLWYWQRRMQLQFDDLNQAVTDSILAEDRPESPSASERHAKLRQVFRAELMTLSPQTEAKVVLLANPRNAGGADITEPDRFFDQPWKVRLPKEELFKLLDGEHLWSDVDWPADTDQPDGEIYDRLVERITLSAEHSFHRNDVPKLRELFMRHEKELWWGGRAAWLIGISRLLPAASRESLDAPDTYDGELRRAVNREQDVFVCGYLASELVRVGLPNNRTFLILLSVGLYRI